MFSLRATANLTELIAPFSMGIFRSEMNSEIQLPNNIIHLLKIDEAGNLYFFTSCLNQQASHLDTTFFSSLDFYNKSTGQKISITGISNITQKDESLFNMSNYSSGTLSRLVFIKMQVVQMEISDMKKAVEESWAQKLKTLWDSWFHDEPVRTYHLS